ncbi:hypothetical protein ACFYSC_22715 [Streptosporangium sp. NPDC004379]|uniref:hypothetical protein n=1 Tax=Streptosporangium sp. NPDC004379 TaxID=3366189 RepID=UPI0036D1564C
MTVQRSFKQLVRLRMAKTGERYAAARAALLAAREPDGPGAAPVLAASDETIRRRTGRGWEEWFDLLDAAGMAGRPHREIARWVAGSLGAVPLAWEPQAVTGSYERARGRAVGQRADGFAVTVSRTMDASADRLFTAFADETERGRWLPDGRLRERTATRPRSARFDWDEDGTRVHVTFTAKSENRGTVTVEHARLADAEAAERAKRWWRDRLTSLAADFAGGAADA